LTPQLWREALLLRIRHISSFIWLSTCLNPSELAFDTHVATFDGIITYAKALLQLPPLSTSHASKGPAASGMGPAGEGTRAGSAGLPSFTLDMALIPALYLTAIKCRTSWIRRSAIALLHSLPGREGLWDTQIHARVAARILAIQESGQEIPSDGLGTAFGEGEGNLDKEEIYSRSHRRRRGCIMRRL
jgi:hypothetical protein